MAPALLDLNDRNVQLWHGDAHVQSPGYALLENDSYLFGARARAAARIHPRHINTRFWWQLNTEALQPPLGSARHTGDLAHAHLLALHREANEPDEVVLAVSGSMQREQLSLLLGIVHQCPFEAVGLVNRSVAIGSLYASNTSTWHLEIQLHQALLTELRRNGDKLDFERCIALPGSGMLQLQDRLVNIVSGTFVRQTRFDPRHQAESEQELFDCLPGALQALRDSDETNLDVRGYQARITRNDLASASEGLLNSIREVVRDNADILADPLIALLPGLPHSLERAQILRESDVQRAIDSHLDLLVQRATNLNYVTTLPGLHQLEETAGENPPDATIAAAAVEVPTHFLRGHRATPLVATGTPLAGNWGLHHVNDHWELHGGSGQATVNGSDATQGARVVAGDCITIGADARYTLICVES